MTIGCVVMAFFARRICIRQSNLNPVVGSVAINTVAGVDLTLGLIVLGAFAAGYSLYGGLKAVALTDIIQVVSLILGGCADCLDSFKRGLCR